MIKISYQKEFDFTHCASASQGRPLTMMGWNSFWRSIPIFTICTCIFTSFFPQFLYCHYHHHNRCLNEWKQSCKNGKTITVFFINDLNPLWTLCYAYSINVRTVNSWLLLSAFVNWLKLFSWFMGRLILFGPDQWPARK